MSSGVLRGRAFPGRHDVELHALALVERGRAVRARQTVRNVPTLVRQSFASRHTSLRPGPLPDLARCLRSPLWPRVMLMTDDPTPRGPGPEPNDFENRDPLLAARFGEVASYLAESLPRRTAVVHARGIRIARELDRVRRRLAELRSDSA